jgi:hypothetical protein
MTRDDIVAISCLSAVVIAGGLWFYLHALQTDRYKIMEFCRPRGYVGGFVKKETGLLGCTASDGRRVLIRDIEQAEAHKLQDRFISR